MPVPEPALADGHLLAAASLTLPDVETTIALVAGTGSIGLGELVLLLCIPQTMYLRSLHVLLPAFRKTANGAELNLVGVSGGWGYLCVACLKRPFQL